MRTGKLREGTQAKTWKAHRKKQTHETGENIDKGKRNSRKAYEGKLYRGKEL